MATETEKLNAAIKAAKELGWDKFTIPAQGKTLKAAVCTVDGVAFMFSSDYRLCIMCDDQGLYSAADLAKMAKDYGNYADFGDSIVVATCVDNELNAAELDAVMNEIETFGERVSKTKAAAFLAGKDWTVIAEGLKPFVEAIISLNITREVKMY